MSGVVLDLLLGEHIMLIQAQSTSNSWPDRPHRRTHIGGAVKLLLSYDVSDYLVYLTALGGARSFKAILEGLHREVMKRERLSGLVLAVSHQGVDSGPLHVALHFCRILHIQSCERTHVWEADRQTLVCDSE